MRPTKFNAARGATIIRAKAAGKTHEAAATAASIPERTLRRWLAFGERDHREPYATFAEAFRRAEQLYVEQDDAATARALGIALDAA